MMIVGINKSPNSFLRCFKSYSSATLKGGLKNFGATSLFLSVFVPYNLQRVSIW